MKIDTIHNAIMGLIVGDALGVPVEFRKRDTYKVEGMTGWGTYYKKPGTWSDDSSMTLATMDSLATKGYIDLDDLMSCFMKWFYNGWYTPQGDVFDVGNGTRKAILRYSNNYDVYKCGGKTRMDNGNGSLMRILPLAFVDGTEYQIAEVSALTHAHPIAMDACMIYVSIAKNLIKHVPIEVALWFAASSTSLPEYDRLKQLNTLSRNEIKSTGYVVDTLEAALWCLLHTNSYRECVLTAVNLGGDTDTIAAVAGGLAGIIYGYSGQKGIPVEWITGLDDIQTITNTIEKFQKVFEV